MSHQEIRVETVNDFIEHKHAAYTHCPECTTMRDIDLERMVSRGLADRPVASLKLRCVPCSERLGRAVYGKVMIAGQRRRQGAPNVSLLSNRDTPVTKPR